MGYNVGNTFATNYPNVHSNLDAGALLDDSGRAAAPQARPRVVLLRGADDEVEDTAVVPRAAAGGACLAPGLVAGAHQPN